MGFLFPVNANQMLSSQLLDAVPASVPADSIISGYPEYDVNLTHEQRKEFDRIADAIVASQAGPAPIVAFVITGHADKDLRPNNPDRKPGETHAQFEMRISDSRARRARVHLKSRIRFLIKQRGSTPLLEELLADPNRTKTVAMGATELLVQNALDESQRRLNRRVEIFLVRGSPPSPPQPPPSDDSFSKRVRRAAQLIESGKKVTPDTGWQTKRAYMLLQQLLKPNANDKAVDGANSNEVINGRRALNDQGMPTSLCGFPGWWDPPEVSGVDFDKFFFHIKPILMGPGWAPTVSDDHVLQILGAVQTRISQGISLTDEYIAHKVSPDFGYAGDKTRVKLQNKYVRRMKDENDIYWIYRSPF